MKSAFRFRQDSSSADRVTAAPHHRHRALLVGTRVDLAPALRRHPKSTDAGGRAFNFSDLSRCSERARPCRVAANKIQAPPLTIYRHDKRGIALVRNDEAACKRRIQWLSVTAERDAGYRRPVDFQVE